MENFYKLIISSKINQKGDADQTERRAFFFRIRYELSHALLTL